MRKLLEVAILKTTQRGKLEPVGSTARDTTKSSSSSSSGGGGSNGSSAAEKERQQKETRPKKFEGFKDFLDATRAIHEKHAHITPVGLVEAQLLKQLYKFQFQPENGGGGNWVKAFK